MKLFASLFVAILPVVSLPLPASPLDHMKVSGQVVDGRQRPVDGAVVYLRSEETGRRLAKVHTDASGFYAVTVPSDRFTATFIHSRQPCVVGFQSMEPGAEVVRNAVLCAGKPNPEFMSNPQWRQDERNLAPIERLAIAK